MLHIEDLRLVRGQGASAYEVRLPELRMDAGQVMAVVGSSGCGKSTLLEGIGLLLAPTGVQRYALAGHDDVAALLMQRDDAGLSRLRSASIGFVLQAGGLLPFLTVSENIFLPRRLLGLAPQSGPVSHAIDVLGLAGLLRKRPSALSIGERQRVAFVRAMAHEPDLLLADEPTSALDPDNARRLFGLFVELAAACRMATLVVSHDWDLVRAFGLPTMRPRLSPGLSVFGEGEA